MRRYEEIISLGVFTFDEAAELVGNATNATALLNRYQKRGQVARVRRGLYISISPVDGQPTADRFQIASKVRPGAYVAYHSAFEYHGYYNQVTNVVNVAVPSPFKPFTFDFLEYQPAHDSGNFGVTQAANGVRVTDVERTVLDGIDGFAKGMGLDELDECLSLVVALSEERLLQYLGSYGKQFLYQKAGFFLSPRQKEFGLSDEFFNVCQNEMGASKRYLVEPTQNTKAVYDSSWRLVVPERYARQLEERL